MGDVILRYQVKPQQHPEELKQFVEFVKELAPRSYLEIGCKFGGLMWAVSRVMPAQSKFVAVDLPNSHWGRSESWQSLSECIKHLQREGHNAHLIHGDSTDSEVIQLVTSQGPYDLIFIDANHTEKYVRTDFKNYGRLAPVVCFHDIGWNNPTLPGKLPIEVPKVWASLKTLYVGQAEFSEIKLDQGHNGTRPWGHNGIGIIQWH